LSIEYFSTSLFPVQYSILIKKEKIKNNEQGILNIEGRASSTLRQFGEEQSSATGRAVNIN
jgi:hypothetical protein